MRALLIDDERLARDALRRLLRVHDDIKIVGEAADLHAAEALVRGLNPDLILLDIEMPGGDGFSLLQQLDEVPITIFTTAYDSYAVRAFETNALDYLVKPISAERLAASLLRARKTFSQLRHPDLAGKGNRPTSLRQIFVREGDHCWIVRLADVFLLESEGNYTRLLFHREQPLIPRSLAKIQEKLDPNLFFRANRFQIINLRAIESVDQDTNGSIAVWMPLGKRVAISRRRSLRLKEIMSL